jgi:hemerythrin
MTERSEIDTLWDNLPTASWADGYAIGIAEIDAQHRQLFDCLDRLERCLGTNYIYAQALDALTSLIDYTKTHFSVEESVLRMLRYPDLAVHIEEHQTFNRKLGSFRLRLQRNEDISGELAHFIRTWLVKHIQKSDQQYVPHLLNGRIDPNAGPET